MNLNSTFFSARPCIFFVGFNGPATALPLETPCALDMISGICLGHLDIFLCTMLITSAAIAPSVAIIAPKGMGPWKRGGSLESDDVVNSVVSGWLAAFRARGRSLSIDLVRRPLQTHRAWRAIKRCSQHVVMGGN